MVNIKPLPTDSAWEYTADDNTNCQSHSPVSLSTERCCSHRQSPAFYVDRPTYGLKPGAEPYYPCMRTAAYPAAEARPPPGAASPPAPPPGPRPPGAGPAPAPQTQSSEKGERERKQRKPYEEIGAIFNGNEVKIRVPKSTCKPPRLTPSQQKLHQTCTCEDDESVCDEACGFGGAGADDNRLTFQIPDDICESLTNRTALNSEMVYSKKMAHDTMCQLCNVTPKDAPKGVNAQKILYPDKDVFVLNIGKQTDEPNRTGSIQVELITPRAPAKLPPPSHFCKQVQCQDEELPCCEAPCRAPRAAAAGSGARKRPPRRPRRCR